MAPDFAIMGIKLGNIDVASEIIDLRFQLLRTQMLIDEIIKRNNLKNLPTRQEMVDLENKAIETLRKKYPDMGIKKE